MRILVTGGAGFIGSHYARTMLSGGYPGYELARVTVLDKMTYAGNRDNLPRHHPRLEFVQGDVCDQGLLRDLLPGHDAVVHFAAESHVDRSIESGDAFCRTNVTGTQILLGACLDSAIARIVHVSTDEVYGSVAQGSCTEACPMRPTSPYAASKAGADMMALAYWKTHGLDVSITRCSNNYGPYQHPEKLIPRFVTNLLEGERLPLYGDGLHTRQWIHVDDHCRAIQLVLTHGGAGEIYNVGGDAERTNLALTERLLREYGADRDMIRRVPDRKGHDRRYAIDETKIRTELGYAPAIPFDEGLAGTVAWYRENVAWWKAIKYRDRNGATR